MNASTRTSVLANKTIAACLIVCIASGCAAAGGPAQLGSSLAGAASDADWSRVRQLVSGSEILIMIQGLQARSRWFVAADESSLVVLNLGAAALPSAAARTLRDMAAQNPGRLVALQNGGAFEQNRVRIGRDGVNVDQRRVAAFDEVLENIPRNRVVEIEGPVVVRGSIAGSLIGAWLGFAVGVVPALGGASEGVAWLLLAGSVATGGYLGHYWSRRSIEGLVYRAPQAAR